MHKADDPTRDIYRMMDESKLGISKLSSAKPMSQIINEIRTDLAVRLKAYIAQRDQQQFDRGVEEGRANAEERK